MKYFELCVQIMIDMLVFMAMYSMLSMVLVGFWLTVAYIFAAVLYIAWSISRQRERALTRVTKEMNELFKALGEPEIDTSAFTTERRERNTQLVIELNPRKWGWVKRIATSSAKTAEA